MSLNTFWLQDTNIYYGEVEARNGDTWLLHTVDGVVEINPGPNSMAHGNYLAAWRARYAVYFPSPEESKNYRKAPVAELMYPQINWFAALLQKAPVVIRQSVIASPMLRIPHTNIEYNPYHNVGQTEGLLDDPRLKIEWDKQKQQWSARLMEDFLSNGGKWTYGHSVRAACFRALISTIFADEQGFVSLPPELL